MMSNKMVSVYGSWNSPITTDMIVEENIGIGNISLTNNNIYWTEMRPQEDGRTVIVMRNVDGIIKDVIPQGYNARTQVHEYGGKPYLVVGETVYFSNFLDQRIYQIAPNSQPEPITADSKVRYADFQYDKYRNRIICVREDHTQSDEEAINTIVSIDLNYGGVGTIIISGDDFYSNPTISPDGTKIAWLTWNHPNLPWDGNELWVGEFIDDGTIQSSIKVDGGDDISIFQPMWSPDGILYYVSDRTGWWNLYRWNMNQAEVMLLMEAEFGLPQWVFGMSTYGFTSDREIICKYEQNGISHLGRLDLHHKVITEISIPYSYISSLQISKKNAVYIGGSSATPPLIVSLDLDTSESVILRKSSNLNIDLIYLSSPEMLEFATENNLTAYAIYYPPHNADFLAPQGSLPPLIVMSHGGPTAATNTLFDVTIQFWTSRGFAILDVNYGGSTGYGRVYRQRLNGQWGIVDVADCINGVKYLIKRHLVDPKKIAITGGSAGGYTTLCALTFHNIFQAGASYFGISDLVTIAEDTHKFESHYLERLIGPYPEAIDLYRQRSPIYFIDNISTPMILFQGLEDKIVPPNQAEMMFNAVRDKGLPVAYLSFEGEQHGFRKAENIKRSLEAELYFYSRVFDFELPDHIEPIQIENL